MATEQITVCGGGNASHALAGLLGNRGHRVHMFADYGDEAERLQSGYEKNGSITCHMADDVVRKGTVTLITKDPAEAVSGSQLIFIPLPSFAVTPVLRKLVPHLEPNATVGALPGQGAFDWEAGQILKEANRTDITLFGMNTLPYACRVIEYGSEVAIPGIKESIHMATQPSSAGPKLAPQLTEMLELEVKLYPNFLVNCLSPANQIVHPTFMWGHFKDCTGDTTIVKNPLFYFGVSQEACDLLVKENEEMREMCRKLDARKPGLLLETSTPTIHQLILDCYQTSIQDTSTLFTSFRTNSVYEKITSPVVTHEDGRMTPNFNCRYLTEDIPEGLCILKGIAELLDHPTPNIDFVLRWAQERMGKVYIDAEGRFNGKDVVETRAPQSYGLKTVEDLLSLYDV